MAIRRPFNLQAWIDEHRHELKPPWAIATCHDAGDYIVMIVAGPNARKDYHYNETEELFYQIEGDINVRIQEDGKTVDIPIREEMFLLPAGVPPFPMRSEGRIGLVIECKRQKRIPTACSGSAMPATTSCTILFPGEYRRTSCPGSGILQQCGDADLFPTVAK